MQFSGSIQEAMAACTLRRQPLLLAIVDSHEQLAVIKDAKLVGHCLYHVVVAGSAEHEQVDGLCNDAVKKIIPRVHVFPPQRRGLTPTVFLGEELTAGVLRNAVLVASEWTKDECTKGMQWALGTTRSIERRAVVGNSQVRPPPVAPEPKSKIPSTSTTDDTPGPTRIAVADKPKSSPTTATSLPMLPVEMPDGSIQKMQFHGKATLNLVRKRVVSEGAAHGVTSEFFHFILCTKRRIDGREGCRKIPRREEDRTNLLDLGVTLVGSACGDDASEFETALLKVFVDSGSGPKEAKKNTKKVAFMYPGARQPEEVVVDGDKMLSELWATLREPSGDWMFLAGQKRKVTMQEAATMKAEVLFAEARVMLLYAPKPSSASSSIGAPRAAHVDPMAIGADLVPPPRSTPTEQQPSPGGLGSSSPSPLAESTQSGADKDIQVKIVIPGQKDALIHTVNEGCQLLEIKKYIVAQEEKSGATPDQAVAYSSNMQLHLAYPPRRFTEADDSVPLRALKITNLSTIRVTYTTANPTGGGGATSGGWMGGIGKIASGVAGWIGGKKEEAPQPSATGPRVSHNRGGIHTLKPDDNNGDEDSGDDTDPEKKKGNRYYGGSSTEYQDKK